MSNKAEFSPHLDPDKEAWVERSHWWRSACMAESDGKLQELKLGLTPSCRAQSTDWMQGLSSVTVRGVFRCAGACLWKASGIYAGRKASFIY